MKYQKQLNIDTDKIYDFAIVGKQTWEKDERKWGVRKVNDELVPVKQLIIWRREQIISGITITFEDDHKTEIGNVSGKAESSKSIDVSNAGLAAMSIGDNQGRDRVTEVSVSNNRGETVTWKRKNAGVDRRIDVNVGNGRLYGFTYVLNKDGRIASLGAYCGESTATFTIKLMHYNTHIFLDSIAATAANALRKKVSYKDKDRKNYILEHSKTLNQNVICFNEVWAQNQRINVKDKLQDNGFCFSFLPGKGSITKATSGLVCASKIKKLIDQGKEGKNFKEFRDMKGEDAFSTKGIGWVNLLTPFPLRLVFTHAPTSAAESLRVIKDRLPLVLDGYDGLVIFCGDFNIGVDDPEYLDLCQWLRETYFLEDCFPDANVDNEYTSWSAGNSFTYALDDKNNMPEPTEQKRMIDHVFFGGKNGSIIVKSKSVSHKYKLDQTVETEWKNFDKLDASDHYPVFVEFEVSANS